jgi:hypothetical protein
VLNLREEARAALGEWLGNTIDRICYEALLPRVMRFEVVYETPDGLLKTNWYEDSKDHSGAFKERVLQRS